MRPRVRLAGYGADIPAEAPPYRPSLVDRVVEALRRSRWPAAGVYAALAVLCVAAEIAVHWADGTFPDGFRFMHVMLPTYAVIVLPSFHYRNDVAARALADARPLLTLDEDGYDDLRYRLTHLPAGPSLAAGLGGLALLGLLLAIRPEGSDAALGLYTSPATTALETVFQVLTWSGVGVTAYHVLHQMALVSQTYTRHTRINLFTPGPLYALSRLTAANTMFSVAFLAVASIALAPSGDLDSSPTTTPQWVVVLVVVLALAGGSFVAPLWGAHRLLAAEKNRQQDELGRRMESAVGTLQAQVDNGDVAAAGAMAPVLEGLTSADRTLDRISTWPWEPDTLRAVVTALVAPVVIYVVTQALDAWF